MAESCTIAFGRYLRTLRERRGFSLDNVASLSQTFPEQIHKGYLSRCENGRQKLAFVKAVPLSRIYDVPADVLVERMELDMELDRVGSPPTEGMGFEELMQSGRKALEQGYRWEAYGYLRDAAVMAGLEDSPTRQLRTINSHLSATSAARALGRHRYSLHEYRHLEASDESDAELRSLLLERIACCYLNLERVSLAEKYIEIAIQKGENIEGNTFLGHIYSTRARIARTIGDRNGAIDFYQKAHETYKESALETDCTRVLMNLSQCYFDIRKFKSSRRSAEAGINLAVRHDQHRLHGLGLVMLGELSELESKQRIAEDYWRKAVAIAKKTRDRDLRFKAELLLFRLAVRERQLPAARAIRRRLDKLSPWLPREMEELVDFKVCSRQFDSLMNPGC